MACLAVTHSGGAGPKRPHRGPRPPRLGATASRVRTRGSSQWGCRTSGASPTPPSTGTHGWSASPWGCRSRSSRSSRRDARSSPAPRGCPSPTSSPGRPRCRTRCASTSWRTAGHCSSPTPARSRGSRTTWPSRSSTPSPTPAGRCTTTTGRVIGSLCAIDSEPRRWTEHEAQMLEDLAAACSAEIAQRELRLVADEGIDYATHLVWRANVLLQLSQALTATRTVTDVATALEDVAREHLGCHHAAMWLHSVAATLDAFGEVGQGQDARRDRLLLCESRYEWQRAHHFRDVPADSATPAGRRVPPSVRAVLRRARGPERGVPGGGHHQRDRGRPRHRAAGRRRPGLRRAGPLLARRAAVLRRRPGHHRGPGVVHRGGRAAGAAAAGARRDGPDPAERAAHHPARRRGPEPRRPLPARRLPRAGRRRLVRRPRDARRVDGAGHRRRGRATT